MNILGIDNIVIDVPDLDSARHFYGTVLGLTEKYAFPDPGIVGYRIGVEEPGFVVRLAGPGTVSGGHGARVWLEVPDARAAASRLAEAGVAPLGEPTRIRTGWVVEVADPAGERHRPHRLRRRARSRQTAHALKTRTCSMNHTTRIAGSSRNSTRSC
ncbi:VOC family protein [Luethyella okanaganae]|uniref:VOC family protein n=1 Tax=Luethyella okanaganae TaxID=69372 RepID=A0ABW1VGN5_9MICO